MVKSDLVTWRGVTITFLFLQATNEHLPQNNKNNDDICRYISESDSDADIKPFFSRVKESYQVF